MTQQPQFATLGMFIIDEFEYLDEKGDRLKKDSARAQESSFLCIGGGGTYAAIGCRIWLPAQEIRMIVDTGKDFEFQSDLERYGPEMWIFRPQTSGTTRALNSYQGNLRNFKYLTPRIRITPKDLHPLRPRIVHFICSPTRAAEIVAEIQQVNDWDPITIYEPIPDRCVPEELPMLVKVLPSISVLSPNAEEALRLLSMPDLSEKIQIEEAANRFIDAMKREGGNGSVIIRSGALGAFVLSSQEGKWINSYWNEDAIDKVVDVTGAGNSFLGGLAAGLAKTGDLYKGTAAKYASISASFVIEQHGLPSVSVSPEGDVLWNGDLPEGRLKELSNRDIRS